MSAETVEDRTLEFIIVRAREASPPDLASLAGRPFVRHHWRDALDCVQAPEREKIWDLKMQLDSIDSGVYMQTRNRLFPLATSGKPTGQAFFNRAGHKLLESMESTGVWQTLVAQQRATRRLKRGRSGGTGGLTNAVGFADVCGGPGAFSQALYALAPKYKLRLQGFGMTLGSVEGLDWYPDLAKKSNFTPTYGLDGTGDIFQLANVDALASIAESCNVLLVVADGGFNVGFDVANYQETISARILYGQWLSAVKLLVKNGSFVLKLFDSFSPMTRAILYLSTFLFERVHIVKPKHSRVVNSERYLVGIGFLGFPDKSWMAHLDACYTSGFTDNDHVPDLIPAEWMAADVAFMGSVEAMNAEIAKNQQIALRMIIDGAKEAEAKQPTSKENGAADCSAE